MSVSVHRERERSKYCEGWIRVNTATANENYKTLYGQLKDQDLSLFSTDTKGKSCRIEEIISLMNVQSVTKTSGSRPPFQTIVVKFRQGSRLSEVKIRAETPEEQELWFRYIYTVAMRELPANVKALLPGQREELKDIVKKLTQETSKDAYVPMKAISRDMKRPNSNDRFRTTTAAPPNAATVPPRLPKQFHQSERVPPKTIFPRPTSPEAQRCGYPPLRTFLHSTTSKPPTNVDRTSAHLSQNQEANCFDQPRSPRPTNQLSNRKLNSMRSPLPVPELSPPISSINRSWYLDDDVGREDAEKILAMNEEFGNLIVRRRTSDPNEIWQYAVSIKPIGNPSKSCKHYQVQKNKKGSNTTYLINLAGKTHPPFHSLEDIVTYFVDICPESYKPMTQIIHKPNHNYEFTICGSPRSKIETEEPYLNESSRQHYGNITGDITNAIAGSSTLPASGRYGGGHAHHLPRQTSMPGLRMGKSSRN